MKFITLLLLALLAATTALGERPWEHGALRVSDNRTYLCHHDGTPFFWLADTGWLLPQRLNRDEAQYYLTRCAQAGYNAVQVQVLNAVPSVNAYGRLSHTDGWDFSAMDRPGEYGYWDHLDHIVDLAAQRGIYIGMVCIWGGLVKGGLMDAAQADAYGTFLARRYRDRPNIVWIIGGDIRGDVKPEVWEALATAIKREDPGHLMTFHPRGRHTSAQFWADAPWIDFHMYQSGHRRYGQRGNDREYPIPDATEEDVWMYVDSTRAHGPLKPVLDGEPSYEDIPRGLHSPDEPKWTARDVRRYAYWSVFAGACGHTYGHNAIMQMAKPGTEGAYFADTDAKPWYRALDDPGFNQMQHLKRLILAFPYFERRPMQECVRNNGTRYDRLAATGGDGWLLVYNHTGRQMDLTLPGDGDFDLRWMDAATGEYTPMGTAKGTVSVTPPGATGTDGVLIATSKPTRTAGR